MAVYTRHLPAMVDTFVVDCGNNDIIIQARSIDGDIIDVSLSVLGGMVYAKAAVDTTVEFVIK